ncbi:MAG: glycosyltransferase family 1 protein [Planctomycetota bacterium]|nr:MAG: glycosyltransferase family 1 protein [Planctomycetota bacterium]
MFRLSQTREVYSPPAKVPNPRKSLRVLHLVPTLNLGGAEMYIHRLSCAQQRQGMEPYVCAMQRGGPVEDLLKRDGIPVHVLGVERRSIKKPHQAISDIRSWYRGVRKLVQDHNIQVVQAHLDDADWLAVWVGSKTNIPVCITFHDTKLLPQDRDSQSGRAGLRRRLQRWVFPKAGALLAVGPEVRDLLLQIPGVQADQVRVIPSSIVVPERPSPEQLEGWRKSHADLMEAGPHLLCVGRMVAEKGQELVLEAMTEVIPRFPEARLWFAGDGPLRPQWEALAEKLGISGNVRFLGHRLDVPELLWLADLFVTGTRREGVGLAAAEALAACLPVVAFAVDGLNHVVEPGTGILVPDGKAQAMAEAICALLADPERRRRMGEQGRKSAFRFDVGRSSELTEKVYRSLIS